MRKIAVLSALTVVYLVMAISLLFVYQNAAQEANDKIGYNDFQYYRTYLFRGFVAGAPFLVFAGLSTVTKRHRKLITAVAGISFVIVGILLLWVAWDHQLGLNSLNRDLEENLGSRFLNAWLVPALRDLTAKSIPIYATAGIMFVVLGVILCLMPKLSFKAVTVDSVQVAGSITFILSSLILGSFSVQPGTCAGP